jgi:hypothetical protein
MASGIFYNSVISTASSGNLRGFMQCYRSVRFFTDPDPRFRVPYPDFKDPDPDPTHLLASVNKNNFFQHHSTNKKFS